MSQDFLNSHLTDLDLNGICALAVDDTALKMARAQFWPQLEIKISAVLQVVPMSTSCCVHLDPTLIPPFLCMDFS